jgi:hypothetical protein
MADVAEIVVEEVAEIVVEEVAAIVEMADAVRVVVVKVDKVVHVHHVVTKINFTFIKMIKPYSPSGCKVFLSSFSLRAPRPEAIYLCDSGKCFLRESEATAAIAPRKN